MADFNRNVHCLLGLPVDAVTLEDAVAHIRTAAHGGKRCFLSTPNLNFVSMALQDEAFRDSVLQSDLSTADGMPLVWIARLLGIPLRERVAGSSVFAALDKPPTASSDRPRAAGQRLSVFFFGGPPGAAKSAAERLAGPIGGLLPVGWHDPGRVDLDAPCDPESVARINASAADFLVVALGARKGQAWLMRNRAQLKTPVISHLGAVVNFAAGTVRPAPCWMQQAGLEWLWRIKEEPALWQRYARDAGTLLRLVLTRVLPLAIHTRLGRGQPAARRPSGTAATISQHHAGDGRLLIQLAGTWQQRNLAPLRRCLAHATQSAQAIEIDLGGIRRIDTAFLGLLMLLRGHQAEIGQALRLHGANPSLRRTFRFACAEFLLAESAD